MSKPEVLASIINSDGMGHLRSHGSYIDDYYDENGRMWERVMQLSDNMATTMLLEARVGKNPTDENAYDNVPGVFAATLSDEPLLPMNKAFVVFQQQDFHLYAIYRHDWKTYLVRADWRRVRRYVQQKPATTRPAFKDYLDTLAGQYHFE